MNNIIRKEVQNDTRNGVRKDGSELFLFRAVPFDQSQLDALFGIVESAGYVPILCDPEASPDADALARCAAMLGAFPPEWLALAPNLKWLQASSAGIERYLSGGSLRESATLTNASGAFGATIAEHMMACLLMFYRRMPLYMRHQSAREWIPEPANRTVDGSIVTIVGLGDLGESFARRIRPFGARVLGVRRDTANPPDFVDELYPVSELDRAIVNADAVALCLPDTPQTRGILSKERIRALKPGAVVINVGRGSAIDESALIDALQEGRLGGAALDVFQQEPLPNDSPLWDLDNVIITPHVSGRDYDPHNQEIIFNIFYDNLCRFVKGEPLKNIVDRARGY
ncbi:MAG: D-2-hydroxyacid dehydrogenase [Oscillospiraceae bacterium]|jgi:phosphoglycerate dehydrogenase-like enzyme|nr:D-2-hydroxyacid dehydrogenase [Oscillospiraceae bacterium]